MVRRGKERDLGNAFKPGSNDPTLASYYGEDNPASPSWPPVQTSSYSWGSPEADSPFEGVNSCPPALWYPGERPGAQASLSGERSLNRQPGEVARDAAKLIPLHIAGPSESTRSESLPSSDNDEGLGIMGTTGPYRQTAASSSKKLKLARASRTSRKTSSLVKCDRSNESGLPCGETFPRPTELNKHIKKVHDEPAFECAAAAALKCSKMFKSEREMIRHVRSSHRQFAGQPENGTAQEIMECVLCNQTFERDDHYTRHFREQNGGKRRGSGKK
ncbi:uncharacterized protein VDAG_09164 [Verticillium dahliae VdLs.17]|uniref:C2H2-type domain-containing protein n=1 Tax=Verticillium dahliae (strain VdLs.17 / ATCC MYA-4575 / FGSC 10137) TaxID=498257 RepID=G2XFP0_VERDV|nr:uncharacterized protein VDAG_09164 [Verticillium dahliae VdLs.17]EGY18638.1 hypothetical protein VDAG_09164 [Verticillium dahliae VdLs.17]